MATDRNVYAQPILVTEIDDCFFYHTTEVPGYGVRPGQWDLRPTWREYLGGESFQGKRVLDIGTADGFISFQVERQGAEVVAFDLSEKESWDLVPFAGYDYKQYGVSNKSHIKQLNNAFWLCHRAFGSKAKMVYGNIYAIPQEIGQVDVAIFGSILLHLRDPFTALQNALVLTHETVIIAEPLGQDLVTRILSRLGMPYMQFLPKHTNCEPKDSWWYLPPAVVRGFLGVLGFGDTRVHYHIQQFGEWGNYARVPYYTMIARRTQSSTQNTHRAS